MNWWTKARNFLRETRAEMDKVTFPSRDEVVATTIVVIISSLVFAIYLYVVDFAIAQIYTGILGFFS